MPSEEANEDVVVSPLFTVNHLTRNGAKPRVSEGPAYHGRGSMVEHSSSHHDREEAERRVQGSQGKKSSSKPADCQ